VVSREASFALRGAWREVRIRLRDPRRTVYVGVDANGAGAALLSAALLRRSYVFLSLELKAMERLRKTFRGAVARLAYRRASGVTVQGMDRLEVLARELRWKHENVFILPNSPFADEGAARPAAGGNEMRARWGIAPGKRIALQAGMINDATCSPELAKGFRGSPDWALVLHERQKRSPDEPYLAGLREINPRNLCLSLEPVPYDQVDEIFAAADIGLAFYKPSGPNDDNFRLISSSGKLPHYLKHGKPVLVSDLPSLSAVVEEFQCGFIIKDPSDEAEVAAALEQVSRRYAELSRNALRCFAERYDFGKSAATLMRFMNDF
jgi:glycosyltransferase involved in cell wall biosynthesis